MTAATPWTLDLDGGLRRDGRPALLLGGQVHDSSTSTPSAIATSFDAARAVHANTVIAPVSWALSEPRDYHLRFCNVSATEMSESRICVPL